MPFLEPVKQFLARIVTVIQGLPGKVEGLLKISRKQVLIGLGVVGALCVLVVVIVIVNVGPAPREQKQDIREAFRTRDIPPEELFLPPEPDFLPEVILERERRPAWTPEDAAPFWTDPLEDGPEAYTELLTTAVDQLMERVP
ncbi:hypothetical protein FACS189493_8330 [Spirochaetia bacterium]|nr:hypothetical protein FACS189493_8330 [Spirochaetia bacterium]